MAASLCALEAALADATPASPSDAAKWASEGSNSGSDGDRTEPSLMIRGDIVGDICVQVLLTTTRRANRVFTLLLRCTVSRSYNPHSALQQSRELLPHAHIRLSPLSPRDAPSITGEADSLSHT